MACLINRTEDGKINKVMTPTGQESKLFNAIHGNIFLADTDTSVKILENAYSEKVEKVFGPLLSNMNSQQLVWARIEIENRVKDFTYSLMTSGKYSEKLKSTGGILRDELLFPEDKAIYEELNKQLIDIDNQHDLLHKMMREGILPPNKKPTSTFGKTLSVQIQESNDQDFLLDALSDNRGDAYIEKLVKDRLSKLDKEGVLEKPQAGPKYISKKAQALNKKIEYTYNTGEPKLFYQSTTGKEYDNLEELLINEDFGQVHMGFKNPNNDEFMPIAKFTTKGSEKNEFLHSKVREGLLSAERELGPDGITRFKGKGEFTTTRIVTAIKVADDLAAETGNGRVKMYDDGTMEVEFAKGYTEVDKPDGTVEVIRTENIPEYLAENPEVENATDLMIEYTVLHNNPRPLTAESRKEESVESDIPKLHKSLQNFLKSLGFSTTTLEKYRENYRTKYGKDPDINALADLTNKIVAFKDGRIPLEDLSEEVAHIAIEAYNDQASINEVLQNIHLTPEYEEFYEYYKSKYSPFFKGEKLENRIKKEILGKILKREFLTRFSEQNKTEEQKSLAEKLRGIWEWFVNRLSMMVMPSHTRALQKLNQDIADSVLNENIEDFQAEFEAGINFYYNAMDNKSKSIEDELAMSRRIVEDLYSKALDTPTNRAQLERLSEVNGFIDVLSSVNTIVGIAENQVNILLSNATEANARGEVLSTADQNRYQVLKENLIPTIENIISKLPKAAVDMNVEDELLLERMKNIISISENIPVKMSRVSPLINADKVAWVDKMLLRIIDKFQLNDKQKKELVNSLDGTSLSDIGWLGKTFGLSSHSKNLAMQLMYHTVTTIGAKVNRRFNNIFNKEIKEITDRGLEKHQRSIIYRDENGKPTFYYLSPRDYARYDRELRNFENQKIAELTDLSVEEVESRRKGKDGLKPHEIIKDETNYQDYLETVKTWKNEVGQERRFTDKYYEDRNRRFDSANVSQITRQYLSTKNLGRLSRRSKYINPDGTTDLSKQTEAEKIEDRKDFKDHQAAKSPYDSTGILKPGLKVVNIEDLSAEEMLSIPVDIDSDYKGDVVILESGQDIETLSSESRIALDLFNLDMIYRAELKDNSRTNKPIEKFTDNIKEIEQDGKSAYDWLMSNANLGLASSFYENMGTSESYMDRAKEYVKSIEDPEDRLLKEVLLEKLKSAQSTRKNLLKQNRRSDSTIETDVHHMTTQARQALLELDEEISDIRIALSVPFEESEEAEETVQYFEQGLNEDYQRMLTESGKSEYDFALQHMSRRSRVRTERFGQQIEDFVNGRKSYLDQAFDNFVNESFERGLIPENSGPKEMIRILKNEYAKRNLATYFKRFQPTGYTEMLNAMKSGELSIADILDENKRPGLEAQYEALKYLEITPEYSWSEDVNNEEYINPNFKAKGQRTQPKFLNDEFFERYGISKEAYLELEDEDISKLKPTRNQDEFDLLVKVTNLREMSLKEQGDDITGNKYLRPQISKDNFEKVLDAHKGGLGSNIKDFFTDMAKSKKDEKDYGEELSDSGVNIKVVPKYYQDLLEDPSLVTENAIEAAMVDLKAAIRYRERLNSERDIKAIEYRISQQRFKNSGGKGRKSRILKRGEVSGYYEKAQEMADYHLYGIRQNRKMIVNLFGKEVDLSQLFNTITKGVRNLNLKFNVITDLTSYTTGVFNNLVDTLAGDYYHVSSAKKASKKLPKMVADYLMESGKMAKKSELGHLMEFYGVFDPLDRVDESTRNRLLRSVAKSGYAASKLANLPVTPKNMLTMLYDHKFYNGRFVDFNTFSRAMRAEKKDIVKKEIEALWEMNTETLYSNLEINPDTGVKFNEKFKQKFPQNTENEFDQINEELISKIAQVNQSVDAIISEGDQIAGQRDALVNATLMHRGWFIINMTRKFKGKHFNISTGQIEKGHYDFMLRLFGNSSKEELKAFEEMSRQAEGRNLKRFGFDALGIAILSILSHLLLGADDDDDTTIENLAQLITLRTLNESASQSILGLPGTLEEIYTEPVIQFRNIKDGFEGLFNLKDEVKREKLFKQFLPYKRYNQLTDIDKQIDSYLHFNGPTNEEQYFSTLWYPLVPARGKSK